MIKSTGCLALLAMWPANCRLEQVTKTNADGVNFDYESVIMPDEKEKRDNYVAYVNQTTRSLQALLGEDRAQVR